MVEGGTFLERGRHEEKCGNGQLLCHLVGELIKEFSQTEGLEKQGNGNKSENLHWGHIKR